MALNSEPTPGVKDDQFSAVSRFSGIYLIARAYLEDLDSRYDGLPNAHPVICKIFFRYKYRDRLD